MKVITLNVNGLRAAARKGLYSWLAAQKADVICLQEIKAQEADIAGAEFTLKGYHGHYCCAKKKGYSGVALYTRVRPDRMITGFGVREFDDEGRYLEAQFGQLAVVSLYMPSGSAGPHRQASKFRFLKRFFLHLKKLKARGEEIILCGDWNIAHKEIDLRNWRSNQKNSGFLPEERQWLTRVFDELGFVDVFRKLNVKPDQYTWWSSRGNARAKNVGWRIDYQVVTPSLAPALRSASVYRTVRFSDHAPLIADYDV